jgi:26S proteasome regulatory subunit T6
MDEIDSIGSARMESGSGNGDSEVQRTMLELLNQLDGFEASNKIKVLEYLQKEVDQIGGNYARY